MKGLLTLGIACTALLTACSGAVVCSAVGGPSVSGVIVDYHAVLARHPGRPLVVRVCVRTTDQACVHRRVQPHSGSGSIFAGRGIVSDATPAEVQVRITDATGHALVDESTTVTPHLSEVNGPDCPPHAWIARVTAA